jgi:hypothetical protein
MNPTSDALAREAAKLIATGQVDSIDEALERVAAYMPSRGAMPGHGRVRQHLQGMTMQRLGKEGYEKWSTEIIEFIEEFMLLFAEMTLDVEPLLVGRAAERLFDGPTAVHIRLYTDSGETDLLSLMAMYGYPDPVRTTIDTRHGKLNQYTFEFDDEEVSIVLTRCPRALRKDSGLNLVTGEPIATATLKDVRRWLGE